ncbi:PA2169 family four-helix-bundle protein [Novosphingobium sp. G106]|uniref:PA2169 family four-helix-bundle protein n=1 Tax=Novosphingobium sp. G106 TaxID=2849500 RepID=UPI001C2D8BC0|nr:PA2169 family four-helix-bundle protein [Novosphingobium sp. G106]MBV1690319.1 PA2169 family four-helix-bundle protein [Novosphingobium sp. G106]
MTTATHDTSILNDLIATLLDSVDGYQKSAGDIDNQALADKFNARARERQSAVAKLQAAVASAGGNPEDDGTLLAGAHRVFMNLKEAVTGKDDKAIVAEIERGEDHLKAKFEKALANADLSPTGRAATDEAWQSVRAGHDEMSALKHSMGA